MAQQKSKFMAKVSIIKSNNHYSGCVKATKTLTYFLTLRYYNIEKESKLLKLN